MKGRVQSGKISLQEPPTLSSTIQKAIQAKMRAEYYDNGKRSGCHEINVIYCHSNKEEWINGKYKALFFCSKQSKAKQCMYMSCEL